MARHLALRMLSVSLLSFSPISASAQSTSTQTLQQQRTDWVLGALREMQTIKPGMTRVDLLKVFREEGGLSTPRHRTYGYKGFPMFKVDVEFRQAADPPVQRTNARPWEESPSDVIVSISRPYIAQIITD